MPPRPFPEQDIEDELAGFHGRLDQFGLSSLLRILEMEGKTGILVVIVEPELKKARLHLGEGRVFRAHLDHQEKPRNAELVCDLLRRSGGKFDFRPSDAVLDDEMRCSTTELLLEAARRTDEARLAG